jgi:hypothetical protein
MKLPKTLDKIFKGAILGGALLLSPIQKVYADPTPYIYLQNNWTFGCGTPFASIPGVPEYMRTVPEHHDDGTGNTVIKDQAFAFFPLLGTDLRLGGGFRDLGSDFPYDFNFGFKIGAGVLGLGGHEFNYTNHYGTEETGYGAALTKYNLEMVDVTYGLFAKAKLWDELFFEYDIELPIFQGILLQNGWDRNAKFEGYHDYSSNVPTLNHTIKIGLEAELKSWDDTKKKLGFFLGAKIPQNVFATASNEFGITYSPSFFGGIQYTQGFETNF